MPVSSRNKERALDSGEESARLAQTPGCHRTGRRRSRSGRAVAPAGVGVAVSPEDLGAAGSGPLLWPSAGAGSRRGSAVELQDRALGSAPPGAASRAARCLAG